MMKKLTLAAAIAEEAGILQKAVSIGLGIRSGGRIHAREARKEAWSIQPRAVRRLPSMDWRSMALEEWRADRMKKRRFQKQKEEES